MRRRRGGMIRWGWGGWGSRLADGRNRVVKGNEKGREGVGFVEGLGLRG